MAFLDQNYLLSNEFGKKFFKKIAGLPVIDPHNHAVPKEISDNNCYSDAWQLFAATDHYVWEMLRKCGVNEDLITGSAAPEEKFLAMAQVFPQIAGNPVYEWIHLDLQRYFGIDELLDGTTGKRIYQAVNEKLATDAFRPQNLLQGPLNVEAMSSTDDLIDTLEYHKSANAQMSKTVLHPTWRPDKLFKINTPAWQKYAGEVEKRFNLQLNKLSDVFEAMKRSHDHFAAMGCKASDHGFELLPDIDVDEKLAEEALLEARSGRLPSKEMTAAFQGCLLRQATKLNSEKKWVMQLHMGPVRDVQKRLYNLIGVDAGGDISNHAQDFLPALLALLNAFDGKQKFVLYTLTPEHWSTLASTTRAFGNLVTPGAAWWLNDTPYGMRKQLQYLASVDMLYNYAGMVSDSRKLLSYGSRFEMFRRILADTLGEMVQLGQLPENVAENLAVHMAYDGPKAFWTL